MTHRLIGKDFMPPDVRGKVTGEAKYAEDFRADGMLFCRLLTSPMPHARVKDIDVTEALAMDGVVAVLTADEVPEVESPRDPILTNTPHFIGEPILAVAAVDETTAQDAISKIKLDLERLPFCVDPLKSLRPQGPRRPSGRKHDGAPRRGQAPEVDGRRFQIGERGRAPHG